MECTSLMYVLSLSLFCQASEHGTNKPHEQVKSLTDEYHDFFKQQLETDNKTNNSLAKDIANKNQPERRFGRGSSGPGEGELTAKL